MPRALNEALLACCLVVLQVAPPAPSSEVPDGSQHPALKGSSGMYTCVYIYVCVYIYIYIYIYIPMMYIYTYTHVYSHICICTRVHVYTKNIYAYTYTYVHVHVCSSMNAWGLRVGGFQLDAFRGRGRPRLHRAATEGLGGMSRAPNDPIWYIVDGF